ncbi:DUF1688 family protein [Usitatibacter palustris]|uniref:Uracil phosphoribosyltransferase n=1 Tax=Usitatibacter palustris TaxID=2732487 RepID=A0A6M4H6N7_9PROT|nr:DUF1688 family protein [Usitatibacter palustris]QJR15291.1 hypothetical protein DSM104440_02108 [Usitatibacter palustris]
MNATQPSSAARLLTAGAVRAHCGEVAREVMAGRSPHFTWHEERLPAVAAYVVDVIRERYPDLRVPVHSRWRHFEAAGVDRWSALVARHDLAGPARAEERARAAIDLVIPSVLLDAGAGAAWKFREADRTLTRSEGLGVASLGLFASGKLSSHAGQPLRSDAAALEALRPADIAHAFQVTADNPLVGLEGRAALLSRLGQLMSVQPVFFGTPARLGNLLDYWKARAVGGRITAEDILATLLQALGPMWPGRTVLDGVALGDCWPHPAAVGGFVPFHKLTQWLAYSLLEPLADGGLEVTGLDSLTGLPEYRNGGLLLDLGLVQAKDPTFHQRPLEVGEPAVVEWRALTVVGLDRLAPLVREALGVEAAAFPLARMLEGGTWAAGRKVAGERRAGATPPVNVTSDGTVF